MDTSDLLTYGVVGLAAYVAYNYLVTPTPTVAISAASPSSNTVAVPVPVVTPVVQIAPSVSSTPITQAASSTPVVTQAGLVNIAAWIYPQYVSSVASRLAQLGVDPAVATYQQAINVYETGQL